MGHNTSNSSGAFQLRRAYGPQRSKDTERVVGRRDAQLSGQVRDVVPSLARPPIHRRSNVQPRPICGACGVQGPLVDPATKRCTDPGPCAKREETWS